MRVVKPLFGGFQGLRIIAFAAFQQFRGAEQVVEAVEIEHTVTHLCGRSILLQGP